ncbi:MAG: tetratricopeptide repeat protein [Woeseiaceae bacterium]
MTEQRSFISELFYRRVPQYLGLYIAGVWMAIEIGDWLTDQFTLPARLTAYIFVFLAVLLPSVAIYAWTHGAPGKDTSNRFEKVFIPLNLIAAAVAVVMLPDRPASVSPTTLAETMPVEVEEVANGTQRIVAFFMKNNTKEAPDWLAYGIPVLISADIDRASARFGIYTPFDSDDTLEGLRQAGFERGMGEPQTIQMGLASRATTQFFMRGEIRDGDAPDNFVAEYALYETETARVRVSKTASFTIDTMFEVVDELSRSFQTELVSELSEQPAIADLPVSELMTEDVEAYQLFVEALMMLEVDRDNVGYGPVLNQAVERDPQFAEAHTRLGMYHYLLGDRESAIAAFDSAQAFDYRLSTESKFVVRINRQAVTGNFDEAVKIARTWTEVEPDNERAFFRYAALELNRSVDLDAALDALVQVRKINRSADNTLLMSANIERQRRDFDAAEEFATQFVENRPNRADGYTVLAQILKDKGDFDGAVEAYEQAGRIESNSIEPELGLIDVLMQKGEFANASDSLAQLRRGNLTDQEIMQIMTKGVQLAGLVGRYSDAIRYMEEDDEAARRLMPPLMYTLQLEAPSVMMAAYTGASPEQVLAGLNEVRAGLQPPWSEFMYWFDLAVHTINQDKAAYLEAFERAETFLASQPNNENLNVMLFSGRAQVAIFKDDKVAAAELAREALRVSEASLLNVLATSESYTMQASMYDLLRQAGEAQEAVDGLKTIVATYPGLATAHLYLAQAYLELGDNARAKRAADRAEDLWSNADEGYVYLKVLEKVQAEIATDA